MFHATIDQPIIHYTPSLCPIQRSAVVCVHCEADIGPRVRTTKSLTTLKREDIYSSESRSINYHTARKFPSLFLFSQLEQLPLRLKIMFKLHTLHAGSLQVYRVSAALLPIPKQTLEISLTRPSSVVRHHGNL